MVFFLLAVLNIVVWLGVLAYTVRLFPSRSGLLTCRWNRWAVLAGLLAALAISAASYRWSQRARVRDLAQKHYYAGIDERQRGNLQEAEKQFQQALSLQPGSPDARRQLQELQQQKPVEKREQRREARVDPTAIPPPSTPAAKNTPPAGPPSKGAPGEKPRPAPHKPSPFEIVRYALDVEIDPAAHTLQATAAIRVRPRGGTLRSLDFSLNSEFRPLSAQLDGAPAGVRHTNDLLTLSPARPLRAGEEGTVTVRYRREGGPLVQGGDLIAARGTYLRSEARWYPATGELDFRAPVRVRARVPRGYSVVSVGALKQVEKDERSTLFHWETERYASMVSLAAAKYAQQSLRVPLAAQSRPGEPAASRRGLKITCYTFPEHRDRASFFLKEAAAIVRFFERRFGPYPYEKLAVVEIPLFPGGYGTTSFVMLIDKSFAEKKVNREFLAHEIAHQWWGNSVFPQGLGAAWLTEAFANYSAWMYEASITGNPRFLQKRVARATAQYFEAAARKGDQAIYETDPYRPVGAAEEILYEKGAVVLHMLRRQVGDAAFLRTLRRFAEQYRFGKAGIPDFQKVAEKESGQQLRWFFDQWLGRQGGMALAYSFTTEPDSAAQNQAVVIVTQARPPYRAKMKLVLEVENSIQTREIQLSEEHQIFRFPVKGKVTSVLLGSDSACLMKPPRWVVR